MALVKINFFKMKTFIKTFLRNLKIHIRKKINPYSYTTFLRSLPKNCKILDVGCGNNSPLRVKKILPESYYIGIDIMDYNQDSKSYADEYHVVIESEFNRKISSFKNIDVVISHHNLEHVKNRSETLKSMKKCLKKGGIMYLVTPSEKSVKFPSRTGTLNYYDDETHKYKPLKFQWILSELKRDGFHIIKSIKQYKPIIYFLIGFFKEFSRPQKTTFYAWCFFGFESIFISRKY